jgi:hypothetical protein
MEGGREKEREREIDGERERVGVMLWGVGFGWSAFHPAIGGIEN